MKKYEFLEHTADILIKAYGKNISECFINAAIAMFDIITDKSKIDNIGAYKLELEAQDIEQLLVDWLSELLFINNVKNLIFGKFELKIDEKIPHLSAKIYGEKYNLSKHKIGVEIKAVTYHMLNVNDKPPFSVKILFDV
jgi:SHS2 domain-containing protein